MTNTNTTRQTAANNKLLRSVKRVMNDGVYKKASAIMNSHGEQASLDYLQGFFKDPISADYFERFVATFFRS